VPRSAAEVAAFFDGLDLVDPGVVPLLAWRPDGGAPPDPLAARSYAAMGRKP
jgi:S-adenosyl methyltransferase